MSDRVIVMSPRPGRIVADVRVPFARPRAEAHRTAPAFAALVHEPRMRLKRPQADT